MPWTASGSHFASVFGASPFVIWTCATLDCSFARLGDIPVHVQQCLYTSSISNRCLFYLGAPAVVAVASQWEIG